MRTLILASLAALVAVTSPAVAKNPLHDVQLQPVFVEDFSTTEAKKLFLKGRTVCAPVNDTEIQCRQYHRTRTVTPNFTTTYVLKKEVGTSASSIWSQALSGMLPSVMNGAAASLVPLMSRVPSPVEGKPSSADGETATK